VKDTVRDILERRSVRKYLDRQISDEDLNTILEAGTYAPTARATQSPLMVVVQDRETISKISAMNAVFMGSPTSNPFYGAPTVVIVLADVNNPNGVQDASLVMGNLMLAAHSLGIGSCWINRAREVFETEEGRAMLRSWGVSDNYAGVGNCILGYADGTAPKPAARKEGYIIRT